jgi:predicted ATPase
MKLKLKNICRISKAEIKLNGLTIIAGENNSGKSTIGKLIFTIIKSANTYQVENQNEKIRILKQFTNSFNHTIRRSDVDRIRGYIKFDNQELVESNRYYLRKIISHLEEIDEKIDKLQFSLLLSDYNTKVFDEIFNDTFNQASVVIANYLIYIMNVIYQRDNENDIEVRMINKNSTNKNIGFSNIKKIINNLLKSLTTNENMQYNSDFMFPMGDDFINLLNKTEIDINKLTNGLLNYSSYRMLVETILTFEELRNANNMLSSDIQVLIDYLNKNLYREFNSGICSSEVEAVISLGDELFNWIDFSVLDNKVSKLKHENKVLFKEAVFIESPIIMYFNRMDFANKDDLPFHIIDLLNKLSIVNKKSEYQLDKIQDKITDIINGKLEYNKESNNFVYKSSNNIDSILSMTNVATGIKSLGILQMLNENSWLNKDTILIIDEPEVHLHPQWQLEYSKIICSLVDVGVNVIINTHSPYIVQSLSAYSKAIEICDKTTFYLTESKNNRSTVTDVTDSLNQIFEKLAKPLREIM